LFSYLLGQIEEVKTEMLRSKRVFGGYTICQQRNFSCHRFLQFKQCQKHNQAKEDDGLQTLWYRLRIDPFIKVGSSCMRWMFSLNSSSTKI
jgi:hypothetical protein